MHNMRLQRHTEDGGPEACRSKYPDEAVNMFKHRAAIYVTWLIITAPAFAHANIGVPMLFVTLPAMIVALIPIILIEAALSFRHIDLPFRRLVKTTAIANLVSTFIGLPLAWIILVVLQMGTGGGEAHGLDTPLQRFLAVTWQAPWLIPYDAHLDWMIPIAMLVLLVPFYFVSWWIEYLVAAKMLVDVDRQLIKRAMRNANFISYVGLALFVAVQMHWGIIGV